MLSSDWFVHVWEQGRKRRRSRSRKGRIKRTQKQKSLTVFHENCVLRAQWHWHFYRHLEIQISPPTPRPVRTKVVWLRESVIQVWPISILLEDSTVEYLIFDQTQWNNTFSHFGVCSFFFFFFGRLGVREFYHLALVLSFLNVIHLSSLSVSTVWFFSWSVVSNSLWPCGLQHTWCPFLTVQ